MDTESDDVSDAPLEPELLWPAGGMPAPRCRVVFTCRYFAGLRFFVCVLCWLPPFQFARRCSAAALFYCAIFYGYFRTLLQRTEPLSLFGHTPRKKTFCFPYSTAEPQLNNSELLRFDTMADQLEISRLRTMGDLLPTDGYDYKGQTPKRLTTRMVRAWRNKHIDGERVWLRRSRYVARAFAWLSSDRQGLFSPASSVITTRLLPTLFMKWKDDGYVYVLCSIDVGDAFLMVPQEELTQVTCVDASGATTEFVLAVYFQANETGHKCGTMPSAFS